MQTSSELAIRADSLAKYYRINDRGRRSPFAKLGRPKGELFHALHGASFEIRAGEAVGIIGRNGAGKSTLLKILSRITRPDGGKAEIFGRVGSLLEVGTGFHPELTGGENIYLNGAVLGMSRRDIRRQFDEIVEFAGVGHVLDTPVKRYSSGMYVRLAFAVAAHLDTEVLLVDEVLAVGDAEFQARCIGTMDGATKAGRTVLFVSHNMVTVEALCRRSLYMAAGRIVTDGSTESALAAYLNATAAAGSPTRPGVFDLTDRKLDRDGRIRLTTLTISSATRGVTNLLRLGEPVALTVDVVDPDLAREVVLGIRLRSDFGTTVTGLSTGMRPATPRYRPGVGRVVFDIDKLPLTPGTYVVDVGLMRRSTGEYLDYAERAGSFTVVPADVFGSGYEIGSLEGPVFVDFRWHEEGSDSSNAIG